MPKKKPRKPATELRKSLSITMHPQIVADLHDESERQNITISRLVERELKTYLVALKQRRGE